MTGETGAPIGPEILEERIVCRNRGSARLVGRDLAGGVVVNLELGNFARRLLRACRRVLPQCQLCRVPQEPDERYPCD